jgi:predicted permease
MSAVLAAMPLAITPFALARTYDPDREFLARAIVLSTMLSAVSIPFWISLV